MMNSSIFYIVATLLVIVYYFVFGDYKLEKKHKIDEFKRKLIKLESMSEEDYIKYKKQDSENRGIKAFTKELKLMIKTFKRRLFRIFIQIPWNIGIILIEPSEQSPKCT